jgi:hypothetical protein
MSPMYRLLRKLHRFRMAGLNLDESVLKNMNLFVNAGNRGLIFRNRSAQIPLLTDSCVCHLQAHTTRQSVARHPEIAVRSCRMPPTAVEMSTPSPAGSG